MHEPLIVLPRGGHPGESARICKLTHRFSPRNVLYLPLASLSLSSSSLVVATQFAAMMATSNLSNSLGDALVAASLLETQDEWFWLMAALKV